jgi:hypothetical protein
VQATLRHDPSDPCRRAGDIQIAELAVDPTVAVKGVGPGIRRLKGLAFSPQTDLPRTTRC